MSARYEIDPEGRMCISQRGKYVLNSDLEKSEALNAELLRALEAAETYDEGIHAFADLECYIDDSETRSQYMKEYMRRKKQRSVIAKARQ